MDSMEQFLAKRKVLPMHMEKLLRQMDELAVSIIRYTQLRYNGDNKVIGHNVDKFTSNSTSPFLPWMS
jgi:hypothetical protein